MVLPTFRFSVAALLLVLQPSHAFHVQSSPTPRHGSALNIMPDQEGDWFRSERFREYRDDRFQVQQERRPSASRARSPAAPARKTQAERMRAMYQEGMEEDLSRSGVRTQTPPRQRFYQPSSRRGASYYKTKRPQPVEENRQYYQPRQRPAGYQDHQPSRNRPPYYPYEDVLGRGMPRYPDQPAERREPRRQERPQRQGYAPPANEKPSQRAARPDQWMYEPPLRSEKRRTNQAPQSYEEDFQDPSIGKSWKGEQAAQEVPPSSPSSAEEPAKVATMMTQENKRILIEELGYRRADVKKLKFDLALGLVQDRIRCPKEGVPDSWFTTSTTATHLKP